MRNFLLFTTSSLVIAFGIEATFANPAHHPDQAPKAMQGDMMANMMNPAMMIVMLDTDGDGSLSLDEFQSMHQRMFAYMDKNKDGKLQASEFASHHSFSMPHSGSKQN
ncbi:EF-hand domain-containing protein [Cohaesibacter sp. CAU 1516]|uniref:EF-hand domain-containing protein n=1 Tax=Cohaesibacter sp. CAU 1516 TaxID=2576038 RepID=UPI0010FE9348|nr:EF-hand domain-containing protein [Cohaesibacter sp. CAU 1516]TLP42351.1 EF-hand domain-containing protein [Cohaesibacter sp. CAU 1516]